MSLEVIKHQVFQFLSSDPDAVMAIKGEWGVGKLLAGRSSLKELAENKLSLERYSHVALLGINSLRSFVS